MPILYISLFGVLGILSRYSLDGLLNDQNKNFPVSTLLINILGSLLIGIFYNLSESKISPEISKALIIGFCGGFTTFSSFSYQLVISYQSDQFLKGFLYFTLSVVLAPIVCLLAIKFTK